MKTLTTAQGSTVYYQYDAVSDRMEISLSLGHTPTQPVPAMPGIVLYIATATQQIHSVVIEDVRTHLPGGKAAESALQSFALGLVEKMLQQ